MYDPQPIQEKDKLQAWRWYGEHYVHVDGLVASCDLAYPPSGSDCIRPELWKANHLKWLLEVTSPSRTLVRVVEVHESWCEVVLPGRDGAREHIPISRDEIPPGIWDLFEVGKRCHAKVNIDADRTEDLVFSDWERE